MERLLLVALGGAVGAGMRFGVSAGVARLAAGGEMGAGGGLRWPLATLIVNVLGCFFIGMLAPMAGDGRISAEARLMLVVGLLGGFTTFSAFGWEVLELMREGRFGAVLGVVALNNLLGIGAVWGGWLIASPTDAG
ncbi:MAG: fluoride efflux transporter CrcB [Phycisphaerales bacterium]